MGPGDRTASDRLRLSAHRPERDGASGGILTFTVRNEAISVNVRGRFGDSNGRRMLVLDPLSGYGQQLTLTRVDPVYMAGVGTSRASWEPSGPVELVRQPSGVSR